MSFEFQLGEADQERYQRGDEWFRHDETVLYDSTPDQLAELEEAMGGYRIARMLADVDSAGAQALRAAFFIARRRAGVVEPWASFQPLVLRASWRTPPPAQAEAGDADPPAQPDPEPEPSSEEPPPGTSPPPSDPA